jgi:hypothetical protein
LLQGAAFWRAALHAWEGRSGFKTHIAASERSSEADSGRPNYTAAPAMVEKLKDADA